MMKALDNIEGMTTEGFFQEYLKSNGDPQYRFVNLGLKTVDLLKLVIFLTNDPSNLEEVYPIVRGKSYKRPRGDGEQKYAGAIAGEDTERDGS